jgi:hypothetical protein
MSTHILVPSTAATVRLLLTMFKGTENSLQLQPLNYLAGRWGETFTLVIVQGFKIVADCLLVYWYKFMVSERNGTINPGCTHITHHIQTLTSCNNSSLISVGLPANIH